jgi:hypothetical protein|nr:MAG TPA: hypothetical protein [Caudoviricetes sp.]
MSEHDKIILYVYLHNGEIVEAEATEEELTEITEIYEMFTEEKEDLFSSSIFIVGDKEIDMNEVEHIAYERTEEVKEND